MTMFEAVHFFIINFGPFLQAWSFSKAERGSCFARQTSGGINHFTNSFILVFKYVCAFHAFYITIFS